MLMFFGSLNTGEVAEWLKAPLSKSGRLERVSGVRISPSPQFFKRSVKTSRGGSAGRFRARFETSLCIFYEYNEVKYPMRVLKL